MAKRLKLLFEPEMVLRLIIACLLLGIVISGLGYIVWGFDTLKHAPGFTICPFHLLTGKPCPGCGMLRALLSIGQLQFRQAIHYNPFSFPLLAAMISYLTAWNPLKRFSHPLWYQLGLVVVLLFWAIRLFFPELIVI